MLKTNKHKWKSVNVVVVQNVEYNVFEFHHNCSNATTNMIFCININVKN